VNDERARLLSLATSLDDITARITATAEERSAAGDDATAADLFEIERTLRNANRRLARVVASLR
jgi:hypothetical protein